MSSGNHISFEQFTEMYAEVVLPLKLIKNYTYRIPIELQANTKVGCRVLVPFRGNKIYTGIISRLSDKKPKEYEAKYIFGLLDSEPVVKQKDIDLWQWIADYYMCTDGEVMSMALPNYLRLESETIIKLNEEVNENDFVLSNEEIEILNELHQQKECPIKSLYKEQENKKTWQLVKLLFDKNLLLIEEEVKEKYKPRILHRLSLPESVKNNEEKLKEIFDQTEKKAPKQFEAFLSFYNEQNSKEAVYKEELISLYPEIKQGLAQLIKKQIITETEEPEVPVRLRKNYLTKGIGLDENEIPYADFLIKNLSSQKPVLFHSNGIQSRRRILAKIIKEVLNSGKQVLYLVPDANISFHFIQQLKDWLGEEIWMYNSRLSDRERTECFKSVSEGMAKFVIASRSGIFLPLDKAGLIIVDEEHDSLYKQSDPAPRFHVRDTAIYYGVKNEIPVLLASDTPSLESFFLAKNNKYTYLRISSEKPQNIEVHIEKIQYGKESNMVGALSKNLMQQIGETIDEGKQVLLFQNLKGYVPILSCNECGWIAKCINCDVSLTYYKTSGKMVCNHCNYQNQPYNSCPACGSSQLHMSGYGTERLEEELDLLTGQIKVGRFDMESTRSKKNMHQILQNFENENIQVLIGTKLLTRMIDYTHIGLIAIINMDMLLGFQDFRAQEKAYQLLRQLTGNIVRQKVTLFIQTKNPLHPLLDMIIHHKDEAFYERELETRQQFSYPPYTRIIKLRLRHKEKTVCDVAANILVANLKNIFKEWVIGPQTPSISKTFNYYQKNILIKIPRTENALPKIKLLLKTEMDNLMTQKEFKKVVIIPDVDADNF